jgi:dTDP-4-amino-4,6-dideoxygalactose transaminase
MRESFLIFGSPVIGEEEIAEVVDSLRSCWVGTGAKVQRFETDDVVEVLSTVLRR